MDLKKDFSNKINIPVVNLIQSLDDYFDNLFSLEINGIDLEVLSKLSESDNVRFGLPYWLVERKLLKLGFIERIFGSESICGEKYRLSEGYILTDKGREYINKNLNPSH